MPKTLNAQASRLLWCDLDFASEACPKTQSLLIFRALPWSKVHVSWPPIMLQRFQCTVCCPLSLLCCLQRVAVAQSLPSMHTGGSLEWRAG